MPHDLLLHQRALFLRVKKGYSYNEIMAEIPVARSTLSNWLSPIELSDHHKQRIKNRSRELLIKRRFNLSEFNRKKRQGEIMKIRVGAKKDIGLLSDREFFITGIMLYWAEGSKNGEGVQICNADPAFISFIMEWFRTCLNISEDRFQASIHYHEGQDENVIKAFWSKLTGIPLAQFNKSFKKPPGTGHRTHYLQWGVCRIRIRRSADLYHQIAAWKDGLICEKISGKKT